MRTARGKENVLEKNGKTTRMKQASQYVLDETRGIHSRKKKTVIPAVSSSLNVPLIKSGFPFCSPLKCCEDPEVEQTEL